MKFTLGEIAKYTHGKLVRGEPSQKLTGVSINSRTAKKGNLFIAIKGERFDGHQFISEAERNGAGAAVVARSFNAKKIKNRLALIQVKNCTKALADLAQNHRGKFDIPVIAITGSAGKTTTKDLVAAVLQSQNKILKNVKSENNHIGLPLTLLKLTRFHQAAVVELGTNQFGDIRELTAVTQPDIAILTNVGESHLQGLRTPKQVFAEKCDLVRGLKDRGTVIFNTDDSYLKKLPVLFRKKRFISFGIMSPAHIRVTDVKILNNQKIYFKVNSRSSFMIRTPVLANVSNALAAIACGQLFNINMDEMRTRLAKVQFSTARQSVRKLNGCWVIDDTYNANPVSLRSALETISLFQNKGRKILICADMLELGKQSKKLHSTMGQLAAETNLDAIITFGQETQLLNQAVKKRNPHLPAYHYSKREQLHRKLESFCHSGDAILVKGSRGMHMERTVGYILDKLKNKKAGSK